MSAASPKIAVYGASREARDLRRLLKDRGYLSNGGAAALHVMAAHPFALDVAKRASGLSPLVFLRRPGWKASPQDQWHRVSSPEVAAEWLATHRPGPALIALGNERLAPFYSLANQVLLIRSRKSPHPAAPIHGAVLTAPGPFDTEGEIALFQAHGIAALVAHDAGGQGGWPKMEAARRLGLPVVLLDRPAWPNGELFEDVGTLARQIQARFGLDLGAAAP